LNIDNILITGGAGFIGSHITEKLVFDNVDVKVIDNLSSGNFLNLSNCKDKKNFSFIKSDIRNADDLKIALNDVNTVFHMAAYPEVRTGFDQPELCFEENIANTFHLLEQIRKSKVKTILFASSSTIYGEPSIIPTPENYGPLIPISQYGSSKLACEALISSYCYTYGIRGQIFRFANIVGKRSNHGVIWDFINKLRKNEKELEVLGDGSQSKSYSHVSDCIDSIFFCFLRQKERFEIFNIGSDDEIDVMSIAQIVCKSMKLENVKIHTFGGVDNGRGWIGDVKKMLLDISKIKNMGWEPKFSSKTAVEIATKELMEDKEVVTVGS